MKTVYCFISGVWVSGTVESEQPDGQCLVNLATGAQVVRHRDELHNKSPRLTDDTVWPV